MKVRQPMNRITNNTQIMVIIVHTRQISKTTTTLIIHHSQQQPDQRDEVAVDQQQLLLQLDGQQVLEQQALLRNEAKEQAQLNEQPQRAIIGRHCQETRQQQQRRQRHKDGAKVKRAQERRRPQRQQYTLAIQQNPAALEPHRELRRLGPLIDQQRRLQRERLQLQLQPHSRKSNVHLATGTFALTQPNAIIDRELIWIWAKSRFASALGL